MKRLTSTASEAADSAGIVSNALEKASANAKRLKEAVNGFVKELTAA